MEGVKLHSFWVSMFGLRAQYALELKGIPYKYQEESMQAKSQELLEANPIYSKIPVLIHNGKPVCESLIILDYIDNVWPDSHKLLPDDPYERAVARFWAAFGDQKLYEAGGRIMSTTGEEQKSACESFISCLRILDEALGKIAPGKPFFGGDAMNFADVGLAPFICWFEPHAKLGEFEIPGAEECPHLHKWMQAVHSVEAIKKCTPNPDKLLEFAGVLRNRFLAA